jgi:Spy/CpxP family protein refolding chaperone
MTKFARGIALGFVSGLVIGLMFGLILDGLSSRPPISAQATAITPEHASRRQELQDLVRDNDMLRDELAQTRDEIDAKNHAATTQLNPEQKADYLAGILRQRYYGLSLTEEQIARIRDLEWQSYIATVEMMSGTLNGKPPFLDIQAEIAELLTPEQRKVLEERKMAESDQNATVVAQAMLGQFPQSLGLTEDQKDKVFAKLYDQFHPSTSANYEQRWEQMKIKPMDRHSQILEWATEGVLEPEQQVLFEAWLHSK